MCAWNTSSCCCYKGMDLTLATGLGNSIRGRMLEQEATESCWLKLSLILIFFWDPHPITSPPHVPDPFPFIYSPPLPESAPKVSRQAGYWIQTPKLLPGLISSPVFVKKAFPEEAFQREPMPTPRCVLEKDEMIPEANPFCGPRGWILCCFYPGAAPRLCCLTATLGDYFHFSKTEETEQRNAPGQNSCTQSARALKVWWKHNPAHNPQFCCLK